MTEEIDERPNECYKRGNKFPLALGTLNWKTRKIQILINSFRRVSWDWGLGFKQAECM